MTKLSCVAHRVYRIPIFSTKMLLWTLDENINTWLPWNYQSLDQPFTSNTSSRNYQPSSNRMYRSTRCPNAQVIPPSLVWRPIKTPTPRWFVFTQTSALLRSSHVTKRLFGDTLRDSSSPWTACDVFWRRLGWAGVSGKMSIELQATEGGNFSGVWDAVQDSV